MTTAQSEGRSPDTPAEHEHGGFGLSRFVKLPWGDLGQRGGLVVLWAFLCLFFSVLPETSGTFPTVGEFTTILGSQAVIAVLTLGLLIPLVAGDFDVSIAFVLALSSMTVAVLNVNYHWPILLAIAVALAAGILVGVLNGALVTLMGIDPFIVTLGTGTFVGGAVLWISNSNTISGVSDSLVNVVVVDRVLGIPVEFYYALALCAILWYVFDFTPLGLRLRVVGRSREVARLSGINVTRIRWGALVCSALVSSLAGVIYTGTSGSADPVSGTQLLLPAFAAAFLGATTIVPGRFNPWGALIAVYFLVTGISGLQLLGLSGFVQDLFYGGALVLAVSLAQIARRRQALTLGSGG